MQAAFKLIIPVFALCLLWGSANAQKQGLAAVDSIKKDLAAYQKQDTNKVKLISRVTLPYTKIDPDSAMDYAKQGMALSKKLNWTKGIAFFYNMFGNLESDNGNYKQAIASYQQYYKLSLQGEDKIPTIIALNNIGSVYQRQGDFVRSQEYNFKALKLAEEVGSDRYIALANSNIGIIYDAQSDHDQALRYQLRALKINQRIKDKIGVAEVSDKIALIYMQQNRLKEAGVYYALSLREYRSMDNRLGEASVLAHMALLHEDDLDKKLEYLLQAQAIFDDTDPRFSVSVANIGNIGGTYETIFVERKLDPSRTYQHIPGSYELIAKKAKNYLERAIAYSKASGDVDNLSYFSDNLAQLQEREGDYKNALLNYQVSRNIEDSLYSQESKNKLAELTARYLFEKKEAEYKEQQQINALKMRQLFLYAALAVVVVSGIFLFMLNRSRIGQLRLRNELQRKEAEEQTRELLHKNKLSESELRAIRAQMNPHFIFNVLNSIESYILENDAKTASKLVQKFASLSRLILENSTQSLVVAEKEWKALKLYVELEAMRFNGQFTYDFYYDERIDLTGLMLPPMLVQPLIENAIHHGLRNSEKADRYVHIRLEQSDSDIWFIVADNGVGMEESKRIKSPSAVKNKSMGLSAIRERVEIINLLSDGKSAAFELYDNNEESTGTIAKLTLPKMFRIN